MQRITLEDLFKILSEGEFEVYPSTTVRRDTAPKEAATKEGAPKLNVPDVNVNGVHKNSPDKYIVVSVERPDYTFPTAKAALAYVETLWDCEVAARTHAEGASLVVARIVGYIQEPPAPKREVKLELAPVTVR